MDYTLTPRNVIEQLEMEWGKPINSSDAAHELRSRTGLIGRAFIQPDNWRMGGLFETTETGERFLKGEHARYRVADIHISGRKIRYGVLASTPAVRVRLTITSEEGIEGGIIYGWMQF